MERDELLLLGRIDGKLDGISKHLQAQDERLDKIDGRLRAVEQKAAVIGAASGGAMSLGVALIVEGMKHWLGRGGPGSGP
ncbi:hypothetical protein ABXN37_22440 [Piscinibacter sakaiensis]|uniref:Uncharacterized protein n=1 Tax=Piscinibacter sakaiensis TaxID=1547922 RepID=A0A0K8P5L6_PISS1|nr:hypothetical protein [Piscinibacter sakaiensis]GAP37886.1 hypothetical protein ISF6_4080 [Piscinibacter sakaiensis]